jgi:hypothetical protein
MPFLFAIQPHVLPTYFTASSTRGPAITAHCTAATSPARYSTSPELCLCTASFARYPASATCCTNSTASRFCLLSCLACSLQSRYTARFPAPQLAVQLILLVVLPPSARCPALPTRCSTFFARFRASSAR